MPRRGRLLGLLVAVAALLAGPAPAGAAPPLPAASPVAASPAAAGRAQAALVAGQDRRIAAMDRLARQRALPFLASFPGGEATLVLPARPAPYRLAEVRARFPGAFEVMPGSAVLLNRHLFVGRGATLMISGRELRELRLRSTPAGFVTIAGWRASVFFLGSQAHPLTVTSWDPARAGPDRREGDGRAFIVARGGAMTSAGTEFAYLGFGSGHASGVAWAGLDTQPSTGQVRDSRFHHNHIGAYSHQATAMRWLRSTFWANRAHGLDAHDGCSGFLVNANLAYGNGRHGIVLSRGCHHNTLQRNRAHHNGAHGFALDDGQDDPRRAAAWPGSASSHDNLLTANRSWANGQAGIAVDAGGGNTVRGNVVVGGLVGIWLADGAADNLVAGNRLTAASLAGIVLDRATGTTVQGNLVETSRIGVYLRHRATGNLVSGNRLEASTQVGVSLTQRSDRNRVVGNQVRGGRAGIAVQDARANRLDANAIDQIGGSGIVLGGNVRDSRVTGNRIAGRGPAAIDQRRTVQLAGVRVAGNHTDGWVLGRRDPGAAETAGRFVANHPTMLLWLPILLLPALVAGPARRARRRRHHQRTIEDIDL